MLVVFVCEHDDLVSWCYQPVVMTENILYEANECFPSAEECMQYMYLLHLLPFGNDAHNLCSIFI